MKRLLLTALASGALVVLPGCHEPAEQVCNFTRPPKVESWWHLDVAEWVTDPPTAFPPLDPYYRCRASYGSQYHGWCVHERQYADGSITVYVRDDCYL